MKYYNLNTDGSGHMGKQWEQRMISASLISLHKSLEQKHSMMVLKKKNPKLSFLYIIEIDTYIQKADINVQINIYVINSSIFPGSKD